MGDTQGAVLVGAIVAGRYRIKSMLAEGGMGMVFLAEQTNLKRDVALKILHSNVALRPDSRARFLREAQAMAKLQHPSLVAVHDFGEWDGLCYLVMELLRGVTLLDILMADFPVKSERLIDLMAQICDVLTAIHGVGLVHRDLKPENIVVERAADGVETLKLVDFGLAIETEAFGNQSRITRDGSISGTPYYMSPEHCQGQRLDARSDIYSLGAIMYEMLCGETPFTGESPMTIFMQHLYNEPELPSKRAQGVLIPAVLDAAVMHALAKRPSDRPESAEAYKEELLQALAVIRGEVAMPQGRKKALAGDRTARTAALGVPHTGAGKDAGPSLPYPVFVVETAAHFDDSLTATLRANGFIAQQMPDLARGIMAAQAVNKGALIIDIREDPQQILSELAPILRRFDITRTAVMLVGPDDAFEPMKQALAMGATAYIPQSQIVSALPKKLRRFLKRLSVDRQEH